MDESDTRNIALTIYNNRFIFMYKYCLKLAVYDLHFPLWLSEAIMDRVVDPSVGHKIFHCCICQFEILLFILHIRNQLIGIVMIKATTHNVTRAKIVISSFLFVNTDFDPIHPNNENNI